MTTIEQMLVDARELCDSQDTSAMDMLSFLEQFIEVFGKPDERKKPGEIARDVALKVTNQPHYWRNLSLQVSKTDLETDIAHEVTLALIEDRKAIA